MSVVPTRQTSEPDLNQFNIWMRSRPWFIQWHRQHGLNPGGNGNRKLSGNEQSELEQLMAALAFVCLMGCTSTQAVR